MLPPRINSGQKISQLRHPDLQPVPDAEWKHSLFKLLHPDAESVPVPIHQLHKTAGPAAEHKQTLLISIQTHTLLNKRQKSAPGLSHVDPFRIQIYLQSQRITEYHSET